jgi:hypothetical protein
MIIMGRPSPQRGGRPHPNAKTHPGRYRLTIRWYLQGQQPQIDGSYTYATLTQDGPVSFSVTYPTAGSGMARLYWDEPVADNTARPNESFLAHAIVFSVQ